MTTHRHHSVPVHLGGEDSEIFVIDAKEHAEIHAIRFIEGEDNGFYMGLLPFLSPELETAVRLEQSRRMRTDWNPGYGTSYIRGRKWFNNGVEERLEDECPTDFVEGRLPTTRPNQSKKMVGRKWWNDGTSEKFSKNCPVGYSPGRLPGQKRKRRKG